MSGGGNGDMPFKPVRGLVNMVRGRRPHRGIFKTATSRSKTLKNFEGQPDFVKIGGLLAIYQSNEELRQADDLKREYLKQ